jgi:hypothetical protein
MLYCPPSAAITDGLGLGSRVCEAASAVKIGTSFRGDNFLKQGDGLKTLTPSLTAV